MFETAFEKARSVGVEPTNGVMIGDKYRNDMEGGKEAGLTTVSHGAEDGPAVDHHVDDLRELLRIVGVEE
jgi:putative hydrolase of the HAD superfamily